MAIVTADTVESKLRQWQLGQLTASEVHEWAENTHVSTWEPETEAVNEVLATLDMLNINLVTAQDVPPLLEALRAEDASQLLDAYFNAIDFEARKKQLANDPLYARFCGEP